MKIILFLLLGLAVFSANAIPDYPDCSKDPVKDDALCNILPPECRIPICGKDYNYKKPMWFGNGCYMNNFNRYCSTNFRKVPDSSCNRNTRPPPILKPCRPFRPF